MFLLSLNTKKKNHFIMYFILEFTKNLNIIVFRLNFVHKETYAVSSFGSMESTFFGEINESNHCVTYTSRLSPALSMYGSHQNFLFVQFIIIISYTDVAPSSSSSSIRILSFRSSSSVHCTDNIVVAAGCWLMLFTCELLAPELCIVVAYCIERQLVDV